MGDSFNTVSQVASILGVPIGIAGLVISARSGRQRIKETQGRLTARSRVASGGTSLGSELRDIDRALLGSANVVIGAITFFGISSVFVTFLEGQHPPWWSWILGAYWFATMANRLAFRSPEQDRRLLGALRSADIGVRSLFVLGDNLLVLAESLGLSYALTYYWYPPSSSGLWEWILRFAQQPRTVQRFLLWVIALALFTLCLVVARFMARSASETQADSTTY